MHSFFQDLAYCRQEYPTLLCRPLSAEFAREGKIAMFELTISDDAVRTVRERHYDLVPEGSISDDELRDYNTRADDYGAAAAGTAKTFSHGS